VRKSIRNVITDFTLRDHNIEVARLRQANQDMQELLDALTTAKNKAELDRDNLKTSRNRLLIWMIPLSILSLLYLFAQLQK